MPSVILVRVNLREVHRYSTEAHPTTSNDDELQFLTQDKDKTRTKTRVEGDTRMRNMHRLRATHFKLPPSRYFIRYLLTKTLQ